MWDSLAKVFTLARISVLLSLASAFTLDLTPDCVSFFLLFALVFFVPVKRKWLLVIAVLTYVYSSLGSAMGWNCNRCMNDKWRLTVAGIVRFNRGPIRRRRRRGQSVLIGVCEISKWATPHDVMRSWGIPPLPREREETETHHHLKSAYNISTKTNKKSAKEVAGLEKHLYLMRIPWVNLTYKANKSSTFPVSVSLIWAAWAWLRSSSKIVILFLIAVRIGAYFSLCLVTKSVSCCFYIIAYGNFWRVLCCFEHRLSCCWRAVFFIPFVTTVFF